MRTEAKRLQELGLVAAGNEVMYVVAACNAAMNKLSAIR